MDAQLLALHRAVNDLLRACKALKAAGRALSRKNNAWVSRWNDSVLSDPLEDRLAAAQARQHEAEEGLLARWEEFTQDQPLYHNHYTARYATPDPRR